MNNTINEEKFWTNILNDNYSATRLDFDILKQNDKVHYNSIKFNFEKSLSKEILKISNNSDYRLFIILLANTFLLLNKIKDQDEISIGLPIVNQELSDNLINKILFIRKNIDSNYKFKEFLLSIKDSLVEVTKHQNFPVETLPYRLNMDKEDGSFSLFHIAVLLDSIHDLEYLQNLNLDCIFKFSNQNEGIQLELQYNSNLFKKDTVYNIGKFYIQLLKNTLKNKDKELREINIINNDELNQIINNFNSTDYNFENLSLKELIKKSINENPDRIALVYNNLHITYNELDRRSSILSNYLQSNNVTQDTIVAIVLERSIDFIIACYAVIKSGGCYLPIDITLPLIRQETMLSDSSCNLIISSKKNINNYILNNKNYKILFSDEIDYESIPQKNQIDINAGNALYIIYSSGSTGIPKGIIVSDKSFVNTVQSNNLIFEQNNYTRNSQVTSVSFDAMAIEIWPCLVSGACLNIIDDTTRLDPFKVREWLVKNQIVISYQPNIIYENLIKFKWPEKYISLKTLRVAGEKMKNYPLKKIPFEVINEYGPTEDAVWTTYYNVSKIKNKNNAPLIGKPIYNKKVFILSDNYNIRPIGLPGELCITGNGLATGYLNNPELTNEKFVNLSNPINSRVYKTGDIAKWTENGELDFIERKDYQIKLRGYRIEINEIIFNILKFNNIEDAVVKLIENDNKKYLCAYYKSSKKIKEKFLRTFLEERLPLYMIPTFFIHMVAMPLNKNGKYDLEKFPLPTFKNVNNIPKSKFEIQLAIIWKEVLRIDIKTIGRDSNFFELGGNSILVSSLASKVSKQFNVQISLTDIFKSINLKDLAQLINDGLYKKYKPIPILKKNDQYELSFFQKQLWLQEKILNNHWSFCMQDVFILDLTFDKTAFKKAFISLLEKYEILRTSINIINDKPYQVVHQTKDIHFNIDYHVINNTKFTIDEINKVLVNLRKSKIDIEIAPLFKVTVFQVKNKKPIISLTTHHIITDAISMKILNKDFTDFYNKISNNEKVNHKPDPIQYKDFAAWHNSIINNSNITSIRKFWDNYLKNFPKELVYNRDSEKINCQIYPNEKTLIFKDELFVFLKQFSQEKNSTLFITMLALTNLLIFYNTGQRKFVVGLPTDMRDHPDIINHVGFFINMLPLIIDINPESNINSYFNNQKDNILKILDNKIYPLELMIQGKDTINKKNQNLFQIVAQSIDVTEEYTTEKDQILDQLDQVKEMNKYELTFTFIIRPNQIDCNFKYNLFEDDEAERFINTLQVFVKSIHENVNDNIKISELNDKVFLQLNEVESEEIKEKIAPKFNF